MPLPGKTKQFIVEGLDKAESEENAKKAAETDAEEILSGNKKKSRRKKLADAIDVIRDRRANRSGFTSFGGTKI